MFSQRPVADDYRPAIIKWMPLVQSRDAMGHDTMMRTKRAQKISKITGIWIGHFVRFAVVVRSQMVVWHAASITSRTESIFFCSSSLSFMPGPFTWYVTNMLRLCCITIVAHTLFFPSFVASWLPSALVSLLRTESHATIKRTTTPRSLWSGDQLVSSLDVSSQYNTTQRNTTRGYIKFKEGHIAAVVCTTTGWYQCSFTKVIVTRCSTTYKSINVVRNQWLWHKWNENGQEKNYCSQFEA